QHCYSWRVARRTRYSPSIERYLIGYVRTRIEGAILAPFFASATATLPECHGCCVRSRIHAAAIFLEKAAFATVTTRSERDPSGARGASRSGLPEVHCRRWRRCWRPRGAACASQE